MNEAEFANHIQMQEYAERNGLDYTWSGTALYAKRKRTLPANQFEVRAVRTRRGITMVGLFSASITRAEREAAAPYREAMAAKRLARIGAGIAPSGGLDGGVAAASRGRRQPPGEAERDREAGD